MNEEQYKILAVEWRAGLDTVGIVAFQRYGDKWRAVMGVARGKEEKDDIRHIAAHGAVLSRREAMAFFPSMNFDLYE